MAKVVGPAMSLDASGNMGPICYAKWRGMQIARDVWTGTQPMTTPQVNCQARVTQASRAWSGTLSADDREAWRRFAMTQKFVNTLGFEWRPTGYQVYMKLQVQRLSISSGIMHLPPADLVNAYPETVVIQVSVGGGGADVSMSDWAGALEPDVMQVWRAGPYVNGGYHARTPDYRVKVVIPAPFSWSDTGLTLGLYYWYRVRWGFFVGVMGVFYEGQVLIT